MKNLFLIIATVLSFSATTFASTFGDGLVAVIKSDRVELSLESASQRELILSTVFNEEAENVSMLFETNVSMVQIFNQEGELEMVFPVDSNNVSLGLSLFENGQYRMGFVVDGMSDIQFTKLIIK